MDTGGPVDHECDLFLLSSHSTHYADRSLTEFARLGSRNMDGWGIGSYANGTASVVRRPERAYVADTGEISRSCAWTTFPRKSPGRCFTG
jgi:hypothetical protein